MSIKNAVIVTIIVGICFIATSIITTIALKNKVQNSTIVYKADRNDNEKQDVGIADTNASNDESSNNSNEIDEEVIAALNNLDESNKKEDTNISDIDNGRMSICILGEIMMGGQVTDNLNYMYSSAFRRIYSEVRDSDFTYANFSTNITNLEKIENAKSKYLVTKDVVNGLNALGMDCVSIASDHMVDYDSDILNNTINTLEENDVFVAGRKDMPVYFEKGDKKIAIVSTNAVFIGTAKNYDKDNISVYDKENLEKNIKEAKESADIVIADIHWGREYVYGVTSQMKEIAKAAIDSGADMVIGSHAAGVYPIVKYNDKPIIYSTGYFIGDSDLHVGKESFIFDIEISKDKKIDKINMTPTYIVDKKEVLKYQDYDLEKANSYLEQFNNWQVQNSLDSSIVDGKIVIKL